MSFDNENARFLVVINHEQQYSIWPDDKATCLAHIEEVWTDMRPLSLRQAMA
jgi:MbtH protein